MSNLGSKILLLLLGGAAFGCSVAPGRQYYVIKTVAKEWKRLNQKEIGKEVRNLNRLKLIKKVKNSNGSASVFLTNKGKLKAVEYYFKNLKIKTKKWDGKWRIIFFDIPEKIKMSRNALRWKIKKLGFHELQKSVFIFPYECKEEIEFIIEYFNLERYVGRGVLESIDNEVQLKEAFGLK